MSHSGRIAVAWYGDDFTGSAAVMEELSFAGIESVLYLRLPNKADRARFPTASAIGLAGTARAHGPDWMAEHLPPAFRFLKSLDADVNLYKICSTFDSSPQFGSIGTAIRLARRIFGDAPFPIFPASPRLGRFQCFGNLFARAGDQVYRLDRHPVVSRHPVTPMREADVVRHLAEQTDESIGTITLPDLERIEAAWALRAREQCQLIAVDASGVRDLAACGQLFASLGQGTFVVGSQGVAEALVEHWRSCDVLPMTPRPASSGPSQATAAFSGSLSPTTFAQIAQALEDGFVHVPLDPAACLAGGRDETVASAARAALDILSQGKAPLVTLASGTDDPAIAEHKRAAERLGLSSDAASQVIGESLGAVCERLVAVRAVDRIAVAGGDTSGYTLKKLDALALTAVASLGEGTAIYRLHPANEWERSIEVSLKGGQMGAPDYFAAVRAG